MEEDLEIIGKKILQYVSIIIDEYSLFINSRTKDYLSNNSNKLVKFNDTNTISFFVINNVLYLPKFSYQVFKELEKYPNYNIKNKSSISYDDYLNTNTTYYDYINHVIEEGLTPLDYFLESLLHEVMHICGSRGGTPLEEGINELKTRELAKKRRLYISGMGYPKEVLIAKTLQEIIGDDIMDELTFIPLEARYKFLCNKKGLVIANLYQNVSESMKKSSLDFGKRIKVITNPFDKAELYSKMDYSEAMKIIEDYIKN